MSHHSNSFYHIQTASVSYLNYCSSFLISLSAFIIAPSGKFQYSSQSDYFQTLDGKAPLLKTLQKVPISLEEKKKKEKP